ncbi:hypothetical protein ACJRO7_025142 [Eucalyptus globulus]|uniref:Uncharacterized protein n=1 Tax=Eucalyptus globulus TaxID=34317 RepID=A0ABD3K800_EUCGL
MAASSNVAFAFILILAVHTNHASPSSEARKLLVGMDKLIDRPHAHVVKASAPPFSFIKNRECTSLKSERALLESHPSPGDGH